MAILKQIPIYRCKPHKQLEGEMFIDLTKGPENDLVSENTKKMNLLSVGPRRQIQVEHLSHIVLMQY